MTILGHNQLVRGVFPKDKPNVVFVQEVKASGFELHNQMNYVWNGPFWTRVHGLVSALYPYPQKFIKGHGVDLDNHCVWVGILF